MRNLILSVVIVILASNIAGCTYFMYPMQGGSLITNAGFPITATSVHNSTKRGMACVTNILGLIEKGDASISAAKVNGGITEVATVDSWHNSFMFFYAKYCTIVTGN